MGKSWANPARVIVKAASIPQTAMRNIKDLLSDGVSLRCLRRRGRGRGFLSGSDADRAESIKARGRVGPGSFLRLGGLAFPLELEGTGHSLVLPLALALYGIAHEFALVGDGDGLAVVLALDLDAEFSILELDLLDLHFLVAFAELGLETSFVLSDLQDWLMSLSIAWVVLQFPSADHVFLVCGSRCRCQDDCNDEESEHGNLDLAVTHVTIPPKLNAPSNTPERATRAGEGNALADGKTTREAIPLAPCEWRSLPLGITSKPEVMFQKRISRALSPAFRLVRSYGKAPGGFPAPLPSAHSSRCGRCPTRRM